MPLGTRTDWFAWQIRDSNPAPGYRHYSYGTLCHAGLYGYSWSSAVVATGSSAYFLGFYSDGFHPQYNTYRAYGFQVRCLLE